MPGRAATLKALVKWLFGGKTKPSTPPKQTTRPKERTKDDPKTCDAKCQEQKRRDKPELRRKYEEEVAGLRDKAAEMKANGASDEEIARQMHQIRRGLGEQYKDVTPSDLRDQIYQRNLDKYGDPLGPSIDWLRSRGKSWQDIIDSASRPGGGDLF